MTDQELNKLICKKQKELEALQQELYLSKYSNQINALLEQIKASDNIIEIIHEHGLNVEDCRFLGEQISANFCKIYDLYSDDIEKKQARREKKKITRKVKAQQKKEDDANDVDDFVDKLLSQVSSSTSDTNCVSDVNINMPPPATVEGAVRTY